MKHKELKFIAVFISFILVISILPQPFARFGVADAQPDRQHEICVVGPVSANNVNFQCRVSKDNAGNYIAPCGATGKISQQIQAGSFRSQNWPEPPALDQEYTNLNECGNGLIQISQFYNGQGFSAPVSGNSINVNRQQATGTGSGQTCNDQCFARTSVSRGAGGNIGGSVPIGICSTQEIALATSAISGAGSNVGVGVGGQTFSIGKGLQFGCNANEWCLCQRFGVAFNVNNQQNNQQGTTGLQGFNTASVPGTRGSLPDPADVTDTAPRKPANDVICSEVSRVTLEADINPKLVPTGTQLTITGTVTKFSNTCNGVQYECRFQYNAGCEVDQGFFKTCIIPKDCSPDVEIPGGKKGPICSTNWMRIIGLALMVVAVATIVFSAAIAGALSGLFASGGSVSQGAVVLTGASLAGTGAGLVAQPTPTPGGGTAGNGGESTPFLQITENAIASQAGDMNAAN